MTADQLEEHLRATLHEIAKAAPLENPMEPRGRPTAATTNGSLRVDLKLVTVTVGIVLVMATLITVGLTSGTRPTHVQTSSSTTSSTPTGPVVVPNVLGMTPAQAAGQLQSIGLTNSIDNVNCGASIAIGHVVSQAPFAGSKVAQGSRINLHIDCGPG